MRSFRTILALAAVATTTTAVARPQQSSQHDGQRGESAEEAKQRADGVKEAFEFSWNGYYKFDSGVPGEVPQLD
jgi:hypothetical protein